MLVSFWKFIRGFLCSNIILAGHSPGTSRCSFLALHMCMENSYNRWQCVQRLCWLADCRPISEDVFLPVHALILSPCFHSLWTIPLASCFTPERCPSKAHKMEWFHIAIVGSDDQKMLFNRSLFTFHFFLNLTNLFRYYYWTFYFDAMQCEVRFCWQASFGRYGQFIQSPYDPVPCFVFNKAS